MTIFRNEPPHDIQVPKVHNMGSLTYLGVDPPPPKFSGGLATGLLIICKVMTIYQNTKTATPPESLGFSASFKLS